MSPLFAFMGIIMKYTIRHIGLFWVVITPFAQKIFREESFKDAIMRTDMHAYDMVTEAANEFNSLNGDCE